MAKGYYKTIKGIKYDREVLEIAESAVASGNRISIAEAKELLEAVKDGNEYTETEKRTIEYVKENYSFTPQALQYLDKELKKWLDSLKKQEESAASKKKVSKKKSEPDTNITGVISPFGSKNKQDKNKNKTNTSRKRAIFGDSKTQTVPELPVTHFVAPEISEPEIISKSPTSPPIKEQAKEEIPNPILVDLPEMKSQTEPVIPKEKFPATPIQEESKKVELSTTVSSKESISVELPIAQQEPPKEEKIQTSATESFKQTPEQEQKEQQELYGNPKDSKEMTSKKVHPVYTPEKAPKKFNLSWLWLVFLLALLGILIFFICDPRSNSKPIKLDSNGKADENSKEPTNTSTNTEKSSIENLPLEEGPANKEVPKKEEPIEPVNKEKKMEGLDTPPKDTKKEEDFLKQEESSITKEVPLKEAIRSIESTKMSFQKNSFEIKDDDTKKALNSVAELLKFHPNLKLDIYGHTCSKGSKKTNKKISLRRAKMVSDYLKSKGVSDSRIKTHGMGSSQPIADNSTENGRSKNRRVNFKVSKK